jgi:hypothetical protein
MISPQSALVLLSNQEPVHSQRSCHCVRQDSDPILVALAIPDDDLCILEVNILYTQPQAPYQAQAAAVQ